VYSASSSRISLRLSVSFTRSYKDAAGRYQYTKSFDAEDLGKVVSVAQQATEYLRDMDVGEAQK